MSDRDPRVDPKAGDVLRRGKYTRTVLRVTHDPRPNFGSIFYYVTKGELHTCTAMWREWARNAEILEQAP